ncbi:hypothetical protein [Halomarina rubra]|uniref:DUF2442 domain-containing protein n=1 Tax=Halomarina rubra TaxID=2071873 RepID=A0ABD6AZS5_9EURY|nr:hypothetical protein [Halomarina rubra]
MAAAPGTRTTAVHPLTSLPSECRVLGEVFQPHLRSSESNLFVRVEFDTGGRYRVPFDAVENYE